MVLFATFVFLLGIPELHRHVVNALGHERYIPALWHFLLVESLTMVAILLGGFSQLPDHGDVAF